MDVSEADRVRDRIMLALIRRRRELGLTQQEVADDMGVSRSTVSHIETEGLDHRVTTFIRYADAVDAKFGVFPTQPGDEPT